MPDSRNMEDVFSLAEKMNLRRWNELKIQMRDLDLDKYFIRSSRDPNCARSRSRLQISPTFFYLVLDLLHKKCIIIDEFKATSLNKEAKFHAI